MNCYNESNGTKHDEKEFSQLAKVIRYRRFNRVDKPKGVEDMKKEAMDQYHRLAGKERIKMRQEGFKGSAVRDGPIQKLGAEVTGWSSVSFAVILN